VVASKTAKIGEWDELDLTASSEGTIGGVGAAVTAVATRGCSHIGAWLEGIDFN